ncbi:B3/B4 domain-containing protein [Caballeronia sp. DA-9]|uniref:B3/B4 domain-containing protein n=1 Tax=Caballeronia sp. DA-9 TaxID=3436237 RepID=UPI003F663DA4
MVFVLPSIAPDVAALAPGFRALSISVLGSPIIDLNIARESLNEACKSLTAGGPVWGDAHLSAWDDLFRKFGAKPQRTPCSAGALRKRVLKTGTLPSIDPIVDLYNAISLKYALPVGGEVSRLTPECLDWSSQMEPKTSTL